MLFFGGFFTECLDCKSLGKINVLKNKISVVYSMINFSQKSKASNLRQPKLPASYKV